MSEVHSCFGLHWIWGLGNHKYYNHYSQICLLRNISKRFIWKFKYNPFFFQTWVLVKIYGGSLIYCNRYILLLGTPMPAWEVAFHLTHSKEQTCMSTPTAVSFTSWSTPPDVCHIYDVTIVSDKLFTFEFLRILLLQVFSLKTIFAGDFKYF